MSVVAFLHFLAIELKPFYITYIAFRACVMEIQGDETDATTPSPATKDGDTAATASNERLLMGGGKMDKLGIIHMVGLTLIFLGPIMLIIMYLVKGCKSGFPGFRTPAYAKRVMALMGGKCAKAWFAFVTFGIAMLAIAGIVLKVSFLIVAVSVSATLQNMLTLIAYSNAKETKDYKISRYAVLEQSVAAKISINSAPWYEGWGFMDTALVLNKKLVHQTHSGVLSDTPTKSTGAVAPV